VDGGGGGVALNLLVKMTPIVCFYLPVSSKWSALLISIPFPFLFVPFRRNDCSEKLKISPNYHFVPRNMNLADLNIML
jgi:hypothetical protein